MSGFDSGFGSSATNKDIRKLLGNPKITFVLGIDTCVEFDVRWTCFWKGHTVR